MLLPAIVAVVAGALFAAAWGFGRVPGSLAAAVAWLLYAPYEYLVHARVLCSSECNIRVDLLLVWPALLALSLAVPVRMLVRRIGSGRLT